MVGNKQRNHKGVEMLTRNQVREKKEEINIRDKQMC